MSFIYNNAIAGASGAQTTLQLISRSLRFNSADSAFLSRTPASAGNRKTWTWAGWVKRSAGSYVPLLFARDPSLSGWQYFFLATINADKILIETGSHVVLYTEALYRDFSAWMHVVFAVDATQATATNRLKLYVNGLEVTSFSTDGRSNITQNVDGYINSTNAHRIGSSYSDTRFADGYLADIHFIDGQALTPSSFAETNATTGQWVPKAYTGSYGTNGFRLDFSDNSAATATTLGKDRAGSNNWTPNNFSVTAGADNDSLVDTPTSYGTGNSGGDVRGNYATFNPVAAGLGTLSNGNLDVAASGSHGTRNATIGVSSGKWYAEFNLPTAAVCGLGITSRNTAYATWPDNTAGNYWFYFDGGTKYFYPGGGTQATSGGAPATGIWKIALDLDSGKCWLGTGSIWYDSAWNQTGNPTTGANPTFSSLPAATYFMFVETQIGASWQANFGQRPWGQTCPSGFKALCDTNLPAPTIARPSTVMDVVLWSGDGTANRSITLPGGFSPDFVWTKMRNAANQHLLYDAVRGATLALATDNTNAETTRSTTITSFDSSGFTTGSSADTNGSGNTYVGWCWDAGSSTVTNTQGSITSQVRANASAGFSIVSWTGNGTAGATVGHGLGAKPFLRIIKRRDATSTIGWMTFHESASSSYFTLNSANAATPASEAAPTSSVFSLPADANSNASGGTYVAYCFAPVAGYSSFGSYTGNGSADGPFVYTGHRVRWLLVKNATNGGSWVLHDTTRSTYNVSGQELLPDSSGAEYTFTRFDFLSNGFKGRSTNNASNTNGDIYIYAAFAENPFQYARAR